MNASFSCVCPVIDHEFCHNILKVAMDLRDNSLMEGGGRGRNTPLYGLHRYAQPLRVWFLSHFGHKEGVDFT